MYQDFDCYNNIIVISGPVQYQFKVFSKAEFFVDVD